MLKLNEISDHEVNDLNSYLSQLSDYKAEIAKEEGFDLDQRRLFFRGQANEMWDIRPSVFRDDMLSQEDRILDIAAIRNPAEFEAGRPFEHLTRLQHFGLCTRLLDVTLNPLVAMYFACQTYEEFINDNTEDSQEQSDKGIKGENKQYSGAVYFQRAYSVDSNAAEINIISYLAKLNIANSYYARQFVIELMNQHVIPLKPVEKFSDEEYVNLFDNIQKNYFVISSFNSQRMINQSGAFLLPGAINITKNETNLGESKLEKATTNLINEFLPDRFIIPYNKKGEILDELDFYNINEATLFPDLEHQMNYIKSSRKKYTTPVSEFLKLESNDVTDLKENEKVKLAQNGMQKMINSIISTSLGPDAKLKEAVMNKIQSLASVDWYKKDSIQSQMRLEIYNIISKDNRFDGSIGKQTAYKIVDDIVNMLKLNE